MDPRMYPGGVRVFEETLTPAEVATIVVAEQTFTVAGLNVNDFVMVNGPVDTKAVGIAGVRVSAANTLAIRYVNPTAGALTPDAGVYVITAFKRKS